MPTVVDGMANSKVKEIAFMKVSSTSASYALTYIRPSVKCRYRHTILKMEKQLLKTLAFTERYFVGICSATEPLHVFTRLIVCSVVLVSRCHMGMVPLQAPYLVYVEFRAQLKSCLLFIR